VVAALGPVADRLRAVTLAAIGPTTAAQLRSLDLPVHVQPSVATVEELARAVGERLGPASPGVRAP
jgi:uroporphyrinogen-III synthase